MSELNETKTKETETVEQTRKKLKIAVSVLAGLLVILLSILAWKLYIGPQRSAESALNNIVASQGPITPVNTSMKTFEGQKLETANVEQKALASKDGVTNPPAFIFNNGKNNSERQIMKFYFDFSDQRSRDALIMNSAVISGLIKSGQIELHLHPLFGGNAYSMYSSEALAEVFATDPSLAWDTLMTLLRNAPTISGTDNTDEMVKSIVAAVEKVGPSRVDAESIQNGTFATWLLSIGNDPVLNSATAPKLPYVLIGDNTLTLNANELNNPDSFRRAIAEELKR